MAFQGTIVDHAPFHPQQDAEVLRKAMKGWGMYFIDAKYSEDCISVALYLLN